MAINTGVVYGSTGTYKTANLYFLAKHIFSRTKKPIRYITADNGGYAPIQPLVDTGIVEVLSLINDPHRLPVLAKIVEGYWPKHIINGVRQDRVWLDSDSLNDIGGYIFEGITSISESIHSLYVGKTTGMKAAYSENVNTDFIVESDKGTNKLIGGTTIGSLSMDSFGLVQGHMIRSINYSWTLNVPYVWWSGHDLLEVSEKDSDAKLDRKVITGVALTGRAATPRLGKNLRTMIHAYSTPVDKNKVETRYWFQVHSDNQIKDVTWEAKPRVPPECMKDMMEAYPLGYFVPTLSSGLDKYVELEEGLIGKSVESVRVWKEKILKEK